MAKIQTNHETWKFVGGRLCLDFINTVGGRRGSDVVLRDKLTGYEDLLEWSRLAGATNQTEFRTLVRLAASDPNRTEATFARALLMREALYRIFEAALEGRRPRAADLDILNLELAVARAHQHLSHAGGAFRWTWDALNGSLDRVLWPVTLSAEEVLTSPDISRLRQCEGEECGWIFLDTSRNRSRHWCDMKDCGNRAKVRRFRNRQQQTHRQARGAK